MSSYGRQAYLDTEILDAEPLALIRMLYKGAIEAVGKAREHLRGGRIQERSRQITRAMEILAELGQALDLERGGEVAANLSLLYDYLHHRLQDANFHQVEPPLIEAETLLRTLLEAWEQCPAPAASAAAGHTAPEREVPQMWPLEEALAGYSPRSLVG